MLTVKKKKKKSFSAEIAKLICDEVLLVLKSHGMSQTELHSLSGFSQSL